MWTLEQGIEFARKLERVLKDQCFHCALGGSVLHSGVSAKDLDIFVYPHSSKYRVDWDCARAAIRQCGAERVRECRHEYDNKVVSEYKTTDGKRIDFFFVQ